ncbi:MAG: alkaline phosphatase family protein [Gemmatimonadetes bacterium]|nr:alkaline phosphatase family protein [Gemmatimonadota bacterium]
MRTRRSRDIDGGEGGGAAGGEAHAAERRRVLLVFLDGVGISEEDPDVNPFARAVLPTLLRLLGGRLPWLHDPVAHGTDAVAFPMDASLGVEGIPQSGTGQAALLTGENAARLHGRHFGPWTPVRLRPLVEERSVLRRARDAGLMVAFANAYPRGWPGRNGGRRVAGPPLAARGAGVLDRHEEALGAGHAVASEIVNDGWRRHLGHTALPRVTPEEAGRHLAGIAGQAELTLYAHYATDTAGHRGGMNGAIVALERVDRFLAGVLESLASSCTLLVVSDHGNVEDVRVGHTRNPAFGMAAGRDAGELATHLSSIMDVTGNVLRFLGVEDGPTPPSPRPSQDRTVVA